MWGALVNHNTAEEGSDLFGLLIEAKLEQIAFRRVYLGHDLLLREAAEVFCFGELSLNAQRCAACWRHGQPRPVIYSPNRSAVNELLEPTAPGQ